MNMRQALCLNECHARNLQPRRVVRVPCQEEYREFEILHTFTIFMFTEGLRTVPSVGEWLEGADLIQYENIFMVNGFDDMRFMVSEVFTFKTRMHSSRMRTVRYSRRLMGGCLPRGWCLPEGVVCPGGVHPRRGQNSWHTLVKTLPFRNFVFGW